MDLKALARRVFEEAWRTGDPEVIEELFAPDYVAHPIDGLGAIRGREGVTAFVSAFRAAMPDLRFDVVDQIAEGDRVVTRWHASGTSTGELLGAPPLGRRIDASGVTIHRFRGGQIVESWSLWDAGAEPAAA